jgi:hypothetical protein
MIFTLGGAVLLLFVSLSLSLSLSLFPLLILSLSISPSVDDQMCVWALTAVLRCRKVLSLEMKMKQLGLFKLGSVL